LQPAAPRTWQLPFGASTSHIKGCGRVWYPQVRPALEDCAERDFLEDLHKFLESKGAMKKNLLSKSGRLVEADGSPCWPTGMLNGKRLDVFNLYKSVVAGGGYAMGSGGAYPLQGINWSRDVFAKMRNCTHTQQAKPPNNLTRQLKNCYLTYLVEYEGAHPDDVKKP